MAKRKKRNYLAEIIVIYVFITSAVGNMFIGKFVADNIFTEVKINGENVKSPDKEFNVSDINDKVMLITANIFNVSSVKYGQKFVEKVNLTPLHIDEVAAYFETDNHTIFIDKNFVKYDKELYEIILAHEMYHAAIHFKSYEENKVVPNYEKMWSDEIHEGLADLYSFTFNPEKYKEFYYKFNRKEGFLAEKFFMLNNTDCIRKSFININPNLEVFLKNLENECNMDLNFTIVNRTEYILTIE